MPENSLLDGTNLLEVLILPEYRAPPDRDVQKSSQISRQHVVSLGAIDLCSVIGVAFAT